jgi:hypothetical protein
MRRIVERPVVTNDNRVRVAAYSIGLIFDTDVAVGTFPDGISGLPTAGSSFWDPMRCPGRTLSTRLNTISQRYTRLRRKTARLSQRRRE